MDTEIVFLGSERVVLENEYYNEWKKAQTQGWLNQFILREKLVKKFSWAIPNREALAAIAALGKPIVELGAGSGYWAMLLQKMGVTIIPVDREPPPNIFAHNTYTQIIKGSCECLSGYPGYVLMLCWPPYCTPLAADAVKAYQGNTIIYIGEGYGGCTGDDEFHVLLNNGWELTQEIRIPQWYGMHDFMGIYQRKHGQTSQPPGGRAPGLVTAPTRRFP